MTKREEKEEALEATVYRCQKDLGTRSGVYRITKLVIDHPMDVYHVTFRGDEMFCDCPGFLRQKYPAYKHKHIRVVADYVSRGEPIYADYKFTGSGEDTKIRFLKMAAEEHT